MNKFNFWYYDNMNLYASLISIAGTGLILVLIPFITDLTSSLSPGVNMTGATGNVTSGALQANSPGNTLSPNTGGLLSSCGYSVVPTSNCGTTGNGDNK